LKNCPKESGKKVDEGGKEVVVSAYMTDGISNNSLRIPKPK